MSEEQMRLFTKGYLWAESNLGTPEKEVGYMSEAQMRAMTRGLLYAESNVGNPEKEVGWLSEAQMRAMTRGLLYGESAVGNGRDNVRQILSNLENMIDDMTVEQKSHIASCIVSGKPDILGTPEKEVGWLSEAQMRAMTRGLLYAESQTGTKKAVEMQTNERLKQANKSLREALQGLKSS